MGIDKLTRRRGQALPDRDHSARYVVASAHSHDVFRLNCAGYFHIPIAELVNLSMPPEEAREWDEVEVLGRWGQIFEIPPIVARFGGSLPFRDGVHDWTSLYRGRRLLF